MPQRIGDILQLVERVVRAARESDNPGSMEPAVSTPVRSRRSEAGHPSASPDATPPARVLMGCLDRREELLVLGEQPLLGLELGFLPRRSFAGASPRRETQEINLSAPLGLGRQADSYARFSAECGEALAEREDFLLDLRIPVEELPVVLRQEEGLVLVLAVKVDEQRGELGEVGAEALWFWM